jgi:glutaredoxin-related protein
VTLCEGFPACLAWVALACSGWPTIPQLFVDGEFIGGCDIVTQMHQNGELEELLEEKKA